MPLFRPTELKAHLESLQTGPKKRLSQNFLIDGNVIRKIADLAEVGEGQTILEIGPGPGALTEELLKRRAKVVAVEIDPIFASGLKNLGSPPELTILQEDILKVDLPPMPHAKVVANLPYHLTSPILDRLLPLHDQFESLTLMVQKEVQERMTASAGSANRSSLSVFCEFFCTFGGNFTIKPTCFWPKPKVHSSCVLLHLKKNLPLTEKEEQKEFFSFVRSLFTFRRKMIRGSLKRIRTDAELLLEKTNILPTARPEEITLEQFLSLFSLTRAN